MGLVLGRKECRRVREIDSWTLLYGRRKVGKTTLLRRCARYDIYMTVSQTRESGFLGDRLSPVPLRDAMDDIARTLRSGGAAVIDEFQRLPPEHMDALAQLAPRGILIASGSSYGVVDRILGGGSPLLGHMLPVEIDIISYEDALAQLGDPIMAAIYRDPWIIPFVDSVERLGERLGELVLIAKGLIGEVFREEERELADTYWRALLMVAEGRWRSSEIAGALGLRGGEASASSMLSRLSRMGLVRGIPTLGRERYNVVRSPALSLMLYAEAKYMVSELGPSSGLPALPLGREIQFSVGEMLAARFGASQHYSPREDVDVVLVRGRRREWAFEVKAGEFSAQEAGAAVERMRRVAEMVGLVSLSGRPPDAGADLSLGPRELLEMARSMSGDLGMPGRGPQPRSPRIAFTSRRPSAAL